MRLAHIERRAARRTVSATLAVTRSRSLDTVRQANSAPTCCKHALAELVPRHQKRHRLQRSVAILLTLMACGGIALHAHMDDATKQLSRDIFRHLIEINVTDSAGSTTVAAEAMAQRLRDAGFPTGDVRTHGRDERVRAIHTTTARNSTIVTSRR